MRALDSNDQLWVWPQMQANVSAIATENASRSRYKPSAHEESGVKSQETPLFFEVPRKIECLAPSLSHVRKAGSHVTLQTFVTQTILYIVYSLLILIILLGFDTMCLKLGLSTVDSGTASLAR